MDNVPVDHVLCLVTKSWIARSQHALAWYQDSPHVQRSLDSDPSKVLKLVVVITWKVAKCSVMQFTADLRSVVACTGLLVDLQYPEQLLAAIYIYCSDVLLCACRQSGSYFARLYVSVLLIVGLKGWLWAEWEIVAIVAVESMPFSFLHWNQSIDRKIKKYLEECIHVNVLSLNYQNIQYLVKF